VEIERKEKYLNKAKIGNKKTEGKLNEGASGSSD
jgi:hypothetical protein